jgi:geranylgeranyl pyrophosphate synthase
MPCLGLLPLSNVMSHTLSSTMWQERQAEKLRDEIETLLVPLSDAAGLYHLVKEPLTKARRGLAGSVHARQWPLIPLIVCEAISGHYEQALPAAAALQFLMAAGDVFDDIEDADSVESLSARYGSAVATNVATTLLILAERAITRLEARGVDSRVTVRVMDVVNSLYTNACAGQHLDLSLTSESAPSEDMYLQVTEMKSASQVECACHIGAVLATANQELIDRFAAFGRDLGMAAQIANDIQGTTRGGDLVRRKITLPLIYALAQTDGDVRSQLELTFSRRSGPQTDPTEAKDLLFRTGAVHYATVKMEFYKQRALDILAEAEQAGASVERLKLFLE